MSARDEFLITEKYRPQTIDECILPDAIKQVFKGFVAKGEIPHLILSGTTGVGKTTIAVAMCHELGCDYILRNGSADGIDALRTELRAFASSVSLNGKPKIIILDEADGLTAKFQDASRNFFEEFSSNCRFILTCNHANKIIGAIHSRCAKIEFTLDKADKPKMGAQFMKRATTILKQEGVEFEPKVVAELVMKYFPDYRKVLNELQRHAAMHGKIDSGVLATVKHADIKELVDAIREKDFKKGRAWITNNLDNDPAPIYARLYDALTEQVKEVGETIVTLNEYSTKSYFAADQQLNMTACLVELMAATTFK